LCLLMLSGCAAEERWYTDSQVTAGKALFGTNCMVCHGAEAATGWFGPCLASPDEVPALVH